MEWDVQNVKELPWCFHSQHFHLSSPLFLFSFTVNIHSMNYDSSRQETSLVPWMRWSFETHIDQSNLLQPWCEHQLWFLCWMLCLTWFPDPPMDLLTLCPVFWTFPNSWCSPRVFFCTQYRYISYSFIKQQHTRAWHYFPWNSTST